MRISTAIGFPCYEQTDVSYEVIPEVSPKQGEIFPDWGGLACFGYGSTSISTSRDRTRRTLH
jgi:hypothetical protein